MDHNKNKRLIRFETTNQIRIEILIDPNKTMRELIKFYFDKIKRGYLFGDKDILFIYGGNSISHFSDDLIKDIKSGIDNDSMFILVSDAEDKINLY